MTKLITLLRTHPRTSLALILAMFFIGLTVFIAIVKSVSILLLGAIIVAFIWLGRKSWLGLRNLY